MLSVVIPLIIWCVIVGGVLCCYSIVMDEDF